MGTRLSGCDAWLRDRHRVRRRRTQDQLLHDGRGQRLDQYRQQGSAARLVPRHRSRDRHQPVHAVPGHDRSRRGDLPDAEPGLARLYRRRLPVRRRHDAGVGLRPANAGQGWRRQPQVAGRVAVARPDCLHDHAWTARTVPGRSRRGDQLQPVQRRGGEPGHGYPDRGRAWC